MTILALALAAAPQEAEAQLPPPPPDPFAVSVGFSAVYPGRPLSEQDPSDYTFYAVVGSGVTQRLSTTLWRRLGVYLEASFPTFGVDAEAIQRDYGATPPVVDGKVRLSGYGLGLRWRGGTDWLRGPYAEAGFGWWRQQVELKQEGSDAGTETYEWAPGMTAGAGWVLPLGRALALDAGVSFGYYEQVKKGHYVTTGEPYTDHWINRWVGIRLMAVLTFGGEG